MKPNMRGLYRTAAGEDEISKDPDDKLDYWWNFEDWLAADDAIATAQVFLSGSATMETFGGPTIHDGKYVQQFIIGGALRDRALATCRIVTVNGRQKDRSYYIRVEGH